MARLFPSRRSKNKRRETVIYSPEMIEYATNATDDLSEMISVLKYHMGAQSEALATPEEPSAKESQSLAKTILSLYKQMDGYMAILHPPAIEDAEQPEGFIASEENKADSVNQEASSTCDISLNDDITAQEAETLTPSVDKKSHTELNTQKGSYRNSGVSINSDATLRDNETLQVGNPSLQEAPQLRYSR